MAANPLSVLDGLTIASPCPASWDAMTGDDRVRFCASCSKYVYNVSDLTASEALAVIAGTEEGTCLRLYRRKDGTVLTADCPVGLRAAVRRRLSRGATASLVLVLTIHSAVWLYANDMLRVNGLRRPTIPPPPTGAGVTFADWKDWAGEALGIPGLCRVRRHVGRISMVRPSGGETVSADQY